MFYFSLRIFAIVIASVSASFAAGFIPAQRLGWFYFLVVEGVLIAICMIAIFSVNRRAITIGVLITIAGSLGAWTALPPARHLGGLQGFIFLLSIFGVPLLFVTVPLTIHRLASFPPANKAN